MGRTRILGFNPDRMKKQMLSIAVEEQTNRLIAYAKDTILKLGDTIHSYNSKNNLDRTGNLLNSLCWGVSYDGELKESGFYRDLVLRMAYINQWEGYSSTSYLHEFIPEYESYPVDGRKFAEQYIKRYGNSGSSGSWRVFFAILAPYWGYWEEGFHAGKAAISGLHIMSQLYDKVSKDLKPARVDFRLTKDINYLKSYNVSGIKGHRSYVRGTIERHWDSWIEKNKR